MDISAYHVRRIEAKAKHGGETHWLALVIHEKTDFGTEQAYEITLFFHGPDAAENANRYAAAINDVNGVNITEPEQEPAT